MDWLEVVEFVRACDALSSKEVAMILTCRERGESSGAEQDEYYSDEECRQLITDSIPLHMRVHRAGHSLSQYLQAKGIRKWDSHHQALENWYQTEGKQYIV